MLKKGSTNENNSCHFISKMKKNPKWKELLEISFTDEMKEKYLSYWKVELCLSSSVKP
jgi:hypothetical protein